MALTSTLFTGLSGLDVNQTRLNVVGNNIANVNTVAFKSSRALFKPQFYVTDAGGTPPTSDFGGTNPSQRGLARRSRRSRRTSPPAPSSPPARRPTWRSTATGSSSSDGADEPAVHARRLVLAERRQPARHHRRRLRPGLRRRRRRQRHPGQPRRTSPSRSASATQRAGDRERQTSKGNLNAAGDVATGASILTSQLLTTVGGAARADGGDAADRSRVDAAPGTPLFAAGEAFTLAGQKGGRDARRERRSPSPPPARVADLMHVLPAGHGRRSRRPTTATRATPDAPARRSSRTARDPNSVRLVHHRQPRRGERAVAPGTRVRQRRPAPRRSRSPTASTPPASRATRSARASTRASSPTTRSARRSRSNVTAVLESKADTGNTWRFYAASRRRHRRRTCRSAPAR